MHGDDNDLYECLLDEFAELVLDLLSQELFSFELFFQIVPDSKHDQHA